MKDKNKAGIRMGGKARSTYMGGGYGSNRNAMAKGGMAHDYNNIMEMEAKQMSPDYNESMKQK